MVLGNFILPHWKSLWIPFFQVSNFILQSTVEKELKALTHSADNLQPAAVSFTFHEWLHLFCFHFSHTSFSAIYRRFYLYLIVIITLKQQNATLFLAAFP